MDCTLNDKNSLSKFPKKYEACNLRDNAMCHQTQPIRLQQMLVDLAYTNTALYNLPVCVGRNFNVHIDSHFPKPAVSMMSALLISIFYVLVFKK